MKLSLARRLPLCLSGLMILASCAPLDGMSQIISHSWSSPKIVARVATPDGAPVAGAIVVASWNIESPWNGASLGQLAIAEVVTDQDGTFRIPAWGPRRVAKGHIRIDEPTVRIFKTGFIPAIIKNYEGVPMDAADRVIAFRLRNQTVALTPFTGELIAYEVVLGKLQGNIAKLYQRDDLCYWKDTPRLLISLQGLKMKLAEAGAGKTLRYAYQYAGTNAPQCGDAKQFFMDHGNE